MGKRRGWIVAGSIAILALPGLPVLAEESMPEIEPKRLMELDVFELEYASDPRISPDGERIVYVRNAMSVMKDRKRSSLWIVDADGSNHRKLNPGEGQESSPRWSPDGSRIAYVAGSDEGSEIFVRWLVSGQTARLTQLPKSPGGLTWSPNGEQLAFSMLVTEKPPELAKAPKKPKDAEWADPPKVITRVYHEADGRGYIEPGYNHLFVLPAVGGTARQVTHGDFHHRNAPAWTPDGTALIFSANRNSDWEYEFINSEIYEVAINGAQPVAIRSLTDRNGPDRSPAVSPDGEWIAYLGYDDRVQTYQVTGLYVMRRDGSEKRLITGDLDRSVSAPRWSADGTSLFFTYPDHGVTKIGRTTLSGRVTVLADNLGGTVLGRPYSGGSFSVSDNDVIAYTATGSYRPADVAITTGDDPQHLTDLNSDLLDHRDLGVVEEIWYESSYDQRRIQGWIIKPPGFDAETKYPLLLEIHGGPITDYGDRFAAELQLYAAAGYVVLYANPRGSTGYGETFGNLLHHDYPGHDYEDLISGVDAVIARGYVDPERLYVTGGSAGGIMTAWIVGKTDRFRAAVVVKPVINWYSKALVADNYFYYHDYRYPGSPWENPEAYLKYSPISLVGNVSTPTLVMVGTADLRTPLSESKQLYHALKLRRIDTALVEIPGAAHNIAARPSQMIAKVAHVLAWLAKYGGEPHGAMDTTDRK
ncbi:MAG: S9 family peptidase [Acidobacteriota bacterium]